MRGKTKTKQKRELTQHEIWDDSALVQSWDEALAEYKKYHSIHVRGEKVEDVIESFDSTINNAATAKDAASRPRAIPSTHLVSHVGLNELEDGELEEDEVEEIKVPATDGPVQECDHAPSFHRAVPVQHSSVPSVSTGMAYGVNDESLKNLMMSWYYAGYYTGLYEGQKSTENALAN